MRGKRLGGLSCLSNRYYDSFKGADTFGVVLYLNFAIEEFSEYLFCILYTSLGG